MANFDSGVAGYVIGYAVVKNGFPIDSRGITDISCEQCLFFSRSQRQCVLNKSVCEYPSRHVGSACPLGTLEDALTQIHQYIKEEQP